MTQDNILIIGYPGNGLIGNFTSGFFVTHLDIPQISELEYPGSYSALFVDDGEISGPIRVFRKEQIFVVISDLPFDTPLAAEFGQKIIDFCEKFKIKTVYIASGMEAMNPSAPSDKVYGLVTHDKIEDILYQNRIPKFLSGTIYGPDAAVISKFRKSNIPMVILYTECHPLFPDPEAALKTIKTMGKVLDLKINTTEFEKSIEQMRIQKRHLMQETVHALQQPKTQPEKNIPQIYR